jgi:hypothetical protein
MVQKLRLAQVEALLSALDEMQAVMLARQQLQC